jgi:hypothetical protein
MRRCAVQSEPADVDTGAGCRLLSMTVAALFADFDVCMMTTTAFPFVQTDSLPQWMVSPLMSWVAR